MAKATLVKKAQKDYPEHGIKKGESYWWWSFRFGGRHISKTPPKGSQLISSPFLSAVAAIEETFGELTDKSAREDVASIVEDAKSELENLRDDTQDKFDNMPDGLQQGDTGQLLEERVSGCDDMISELDGIDAEDEGQTVEEIVEQLQAISYSGS